MTVVLDARVVTGAGGGPEKTILNSPRFLAPLGYRMLCAYLHPPGDPGFDVLRQKAKQLDAPLISIPDRGPWDWRVITRLLRLCREERVEIWHGHDYKSNALGLLLKRFRPMRLVTTVHGWVRHTARTPLYYRIDRFCLPRYEKVICVSEDLAAECRRCGVADGRCLLLENGIDLSAYERSQSIADAKARLGFDPSKPLIGAVGRLSPEKGFDRLIQAVAGLPGGVQLVIVGEGDDRPRLQAMIEHCRRGAEFRLAGYRADPKPYYESLDLFALSSLREGLPNVLLEAMALRVPVVATRIAGVPRLIRDGENGRLVPPDDVPALQTALAGLLDDAGLRENLGRAGRKTVEDRYSFAGRMEKLAALYNELLRDASPKRPRGTGCTAW